MHQRNYLCTYNDEKEIGYDIWLDFLEVIIDMLSWIKHKAHLDKMHIGKVHMSKPHTAKPSTAKPQAGKPHAPKTVDEGKYIVSEALPLQTILLNNIKSSSVIKIMMPFRSPNKRR